MKKKVAKSAIKQANEMAARKMVTLERAIKAYSSGRCRSVSLQKRRKK